MKQILSANGNKITVIAKKDSEDFISLTDIAKYKNSNDAFIVINNWMRLRDTIDFIGLWEQLSNPDFKPIEFDRFRQESGYNAFTLSPKKWIENTHAIGIVSKSGRYGGTYAHKDIAFEFASWISAEFKLYIIKDYQRLKNEEIEQKSLTWNVNRVISKINYKIHTDAIKDNLIPLDISAQQQSFTYADEADMLNVALFGKTAQEWRKEHPKLQGNIRDEATIQQLIILSNIESMNAELIKQHLSPQQRLLILNKMAIEQMRSLIKNSSIKQLNEKNKRS